MKNIDVTIYSFDGVDNVEIHNAKLLSKDAFWNSKNVTLYDSYISGESLQSTQSGWQNMGQGNVRKDRLNEFSMSKRKTWGGTFKTQKKYRRVCKII